MTTAVRISVKIIAEHIKGQLYGDERTEISNVATLESATPESLSWVGSVELLERAASSQAGAILMPSDCEPLPSRTVIQVADPDLALCDVLKLFAPPNEEVSPGIHPTAHVAETAVVDGAAIGAHASIGEAAHIGKGTQIHAGVSVGAHTQIGSKCCIWPNVVIREHVTIGNDVTIHPNATIGADGFGYLQRKGQHIKIPQIGSVVIEDDVEIGAGSAVDRARSGVTRVGRGTKIDNLVQIGHNVDIGEHCMIIAGCGIGGSAVLGNHVVAAGQVAISDHVRLGDGVQVAAKSLVTKNVASGRVIRGIPAVDMQQFGREQVSLRKLAQWIRSLRSLIKRVEVMENGERPRK